MKFWALAGLAWLLAGGLAAQEYRLGAKVSGLAATDLEGRPRQFVTQAHGPTVVIFISTICPVSNAYQPRMSALYQEYSSKGVQFVFLDANQNEPAAQVAAHLKSTGLSFPVYKDDRNMLADKFGAMSTPETYVIDTAGTVVYHGAIDNSQNVARVTNHSLRNAIDAVLAGTPVPTPETKAFGCTIKRVRKTT